MYCGQSGAITWILITTHSHTHSYQGVISQVLGKGWKLENLEAKTQSKKEALNGYRDFFLIRFEHHILMCVGKVHLDFILKLEENMQRR